MRARRIVSALVVGGVGAVLLWLFLRVTGITGQELARTFRNLRPLSLLDILAAAALSTAAGAEKWRLVEGRLSGRHHMRRHAFGLSALGSALGQFMPAPVASAVVRGGGAHLLTGQGGRRGALASAWEQLFDIGVIALAAVPALIAVRLQDFRIFLVGAPLIAGIGDLLVAPCARIARQVFPLAARPLLDAALSRKLYRLSLIKLLCLIGMILGAAEAIGSAIPPLTLAAAIPPVAIAGSLSFVPGGLGVNEWSFVLILGLSGIPRHEIATFAIMNRLLVGSVSILVGLASVSFVRRRPPPPASTLAGDNPNGHGSAGKAL